MSCERVKFFWCPIHHGRGIFVRVDSSDLYECNVCEHTRTLKELSSG